MTQPGYYPDPNTSTNYSQPYPPQGYPPPAPYQQAPPPQYPPNAYNQQPQYPHPGQYGPPQGYGQPPAPQGPPLPPASLEDFLSQPNIGGGKAVSWKGKPDGFTLWTVVAR